MNDAPATGRKGYPILLRIPPEMLEYLKAEADRRASPVATVGRQLIKERLDEIARERGDDPAGRRLPHQRRVPADLDDIDPDDAWAYTPEHIAAIEQARAEALAGRVYRLSPADLARLAARSDGADELERRATPDASVTPHGASGE